MSKVTGEVLREGIAGACRRLRPEGMAAASPHEPVWLSCGDTTSLQQHFGRLLLHACASALAAARLRRLGAQGTIGSRPGERMDTAECCVCS